MGIPASYTDREKENVYEIPGFNKTKNLHLVFVLFSHASLNHMYYCNSRFLFNTVYIKCYRLTLETMRQV